MFFYELIINKILSEKQKQNNMKMQRKLLKNDYVTLLCTIACFFAVITIIPMQASADSEFNFEISNIVYLSEITISGANVGFTVTATSDGDPVTADCTHDSGDLFPVGNTVVSCTAEDEGIEGTGSFFINVSGSDWTPPSITAPDDVEADQEEGIPLTFVDLGTPVFSDDIDPFPIAVNDYPTSEFPIGETIVTWTALDHSGNSNTATQRVFINEYVDGTVTATPPEGIYNTVLMVELYSDLPPIYYTTDGSTPTISSPVYTDPIPVSTTTTLRFFSFDIEFLASATYTIDMEKPVITLNAGDESIPFGGIYSDAGASVTDNDPNYNGTVFLNAVIPVNTYNPGDYLIEYNAPADAAGNIPDQKTRIVTILPDIEKPVITVNGISETILLESTYTEQGGAVSDNDPEYSESLSIGGDTVDTFAPGNYIITYNAPADAGGNVPDEESITITVFPFIHPYCDPAPLDGNWDIQTSCVVSSNTILNGYMTIQNNSILTIPDDVTLTIPPGRNITIQPGSGVLIQSGGALQVNSLSGLITHMSDTTASTTQSVFSGKRIQAEFVSPTSQLIGDNIDTITLNLMKEGLPTGTAKIGVFNENLTVKKLFGTIDVATLTTISKDYTFSLPSGETYQILANDRIGIKYAGGDASNFVAITIDSNAQDPFDGISSYHTHYTNKWNSFIAKDLYLILQETP